MNIDATLARLLPGQQSDFALVAALEGESSAEALARVHPGRTFGRSLVIHRDMKPGAAALFARVTRVETHEEGWKQ